MKKQLMKLVDVKSIITIALTVGMVLLLCGVFNPPQNIFQLYQTIYAMVITFYFTKKADDKKNK